MIVNSEVFIGKRKSSLGQRMYEEIEKLYIIRDKVRDRYPNMDIKTERKRIFTAVVRSGWGQGLLDIIKEETNIDISKINLMDGMAGYYAIAFDPSDQIKTNFYANSLIVRRLDVYDAESINTRIDRFFDEMDKVKHQNKVWKGYKDIINFPMLYFDVTLSLTSDKIKLPNGIDVGLTCGETTAIMLHEVGHGVTACQTLGYTRTLLDDFKAMPKPEVRTKEDIKALRASITEIEKHLEKKHGVKKGKLPDYLERSWNYIQEIADKDVLPDGLAKVLFARFVSMLGYITLYFTIVVIAAGAGAYRNVLYTKNDVKYSDFYTAGRVYNQNEFWADEFATMNGFGSEIVSGLGKIIYAFRGFHIHAKKGMSEYTATRNNILLYTLMMLCAPLSGRYETHGNDYERYAEIDRRLRKELRNVDGFDKQIEKDLIQEIENTRKAIAFANKLNERSTKAIMEWGDTIRNSMATVADMTLFFMRATLEERKYAKFIAATEILTNTSMHYLSKQIKSMA